MEGGDEGAVEEEGEGGDLMILEDLIVSVVLEVLVVGVVAVEVGVEVDVVARREGF